LAVFGSSSIWVAVLALLRVPEGSLRVPSVLRREDVKDSEAVKHFSRQPNRFSNKSFCGAGCAVVRSVKRLSRLIYHKTL
jgi:hypothetical protein